MGKVGLVERLGEAAARHQDSPSSRTGIGWPAIPGKVTSEILALHYQLDESQWWPAKTLLRVQLGQLELLIRHAGRTVPFYRERLSFLRDTKPGKLTPEVLARVPVLTRVDVQTAGDNLISRRIPKDHGRVRTIRTSGSTGRPIKVKGTEVTRLFLAALNLRNHLWHGREFSARVGCIRNLTGTSAKSGEDDEGGGWVPGFRSGRMFYFDITRPVGEQLEWLADKDPDYLLTFPSNLKALLRQSRESGVRPRKLRQVATMSETLDPAVRESCKSVWNTTISDVYSSEELGMIAIQCPENTHYHVQAESLFVEILDEEGGLCAPGQVGRVGLTDLHNFATPLIRYEIGDYAEVGEACPCGRGLPVLNRIVGRTRNMLTLPTGEMIWPSFPEDQMMPIAPIRQFQIIQHDLQRIEARLVVARALSDDETGRLRAFLAGCLRYDFKLELVFVDEIARSAGGKYEDFVSRVGA